MDTKICNTCEQIKFLDEFVKNKSCKDGREGQCKKCKASIGRIYKRNNRGKVKTYNDHYRIENKEIIKIKNSDYYVDNKSHICVTTKKWRTNNKDKVRKINNEYMKNNPAIRARKDSIRRSRKLNSIHPDYNRKIELTIRKMSNRLEKCLGIPFHVDHILPLNRGGYHHHLNLQAIPAVINLDKGDSIEFIHPLAIHWSELPEFLLDKIKLEVPLEQSQE